MKITLLLIALVFVGVSFAQGGAAGDESSSTGSSDTAAPGTPDFKSSAEHKPDVTCDVTIFDSQTQWVVVCDSYPTINISQACYVSCAPGYFSREKNITKYCIGQDTFSQGNQQCSDRVNACHDFPCGYNATCHDLPPPATNTSDGRTCACNHGFFGDAYVNCILNTSVPCAAGTYSASGYVPCQPCAQCTQGVVNACTTTSNTVCMPSMQCGHASGDPHFYSLDGAYYDYQGAGEFFAMKSVPPASGVNIQVRFEPCGTGVTCMAGISFGSGATAVSMNYDAGTNYPRFIKIYQNNLDITSSLPITIQGMAFEILSGSQQGTMQVRMTDLTNSIVVTILDFGYWLSGTFCASTDNYGKIDGLLGVFDGYAGNDDPNSASGQGLRYGVSRKLRRFTTASAESLRVTEQESTLHYGVNQSYASTNDLDFPSQSFGEDFHPSDDAQIACQGLSGDILEGCLQDVTATGQTQFATAAAALQNLYNAQVDAYAGGDSSDATRIAASLAVFTLLAVIMM